MADLTSTAGTAALIAGAIALVAVALAAVLMRRVSRIRADQRAVIGDAAPQDLVAHARDLQDQIGALAARVDELGDRHQATDRRLDGAITHSAVIRYDAYNEMTGRQSSSVALLDEGRNGVVLSSILHREQARVYAKPVSEGRSELDLSPEEQAAVDAALGDG